MNLEWFLFEFVSLVYLKATIVLGAGLAACWWLRKRASSARYFILNVVLILLAALLPLSVVLPGFDAQLIHPPGYSTLPDVESVSFDGDGVSARSLADILGLAVSDGERDLAPLEMVWGGLLLLWVLGTAALIAKLGADLLGLSLMSRQGLDPPRAWNATIARAAKSSGCRMTVTVRMTEHIGSPLIWGIVRPTILLPGNAADWSHERLHTVLLHEMLHARRLDHLLMILAQVVRCLYWANPLVWIAVRWHGIERELSCDEQVVGAGKDRFEYAEELVAITRDLKREARYASVAMTQQQGLKSRVRSLVSDALDPRGIAPVVLRIVAVVGLIGAATVAAARLVAAPDASRLESRLQVLFGLDQYAADQAAGELGDLGDTRAIPYLMRVAKDYPVPHTRMRSILAIGEIGDEAGLEKIIDTFLDDPDYGIRYSAVSALEDHVQPFVTDALWRSYEQDDDTRLRIRAYRSLIMHGETTDPMPILDKFENDTASIRESAVWQAGVVCRQPEVIEFLIEQDRGSGYCLWRLKDAAFDADADVRAAAVRSLKRVNNEDSVELLLELADNEAFVDVREMARAALGASKLSGEMATPEGTSEGEGGE